MASFFHLHYTSLGLLLTVFLISPVYGLTCTSQTFTGNAQYTNCSDLPTLKSFLHWSYNPTNATLSIAFIAPPPKSDGWVAWAINPTGKGMAGSQALLAYKASNGSMVVKTYNISSYSSIVESKLSFDVLDKKAEFSNGTITIFAKLALPKNMTTLNQIWQVGPSVNNGIPERHEFKPENLKAVGTLELTGAANNGSAAAAPPPSPAPSGGQSGDKNSTGGGGQSGNDSGGSGRLLSFGPYGFSLLLGILVLGF